MSAMSDLRSATWTQHQLLEKRLDIKSRFTELGAYRAHLEKMWGFCAPLEQWLGRCFHGGALPDYDRRRKVPLLTRDLIALGAKSGSVPSLPCCRTQPDGDDPAAAFGCCYVLEGATLGGRTLLPLVQSRMGLSAERGAAFLASYGEDVAVMWRGFGEALEAWCHVPDRRMRARQAAVDTFASLDRWLCGKSS